jgi:hypothetical protein
MFETIKKRYKALEINEKIKTEQHIWYDEQDKTIKLQDDVYYAPFPTIKKFHSSDARIRLLMGSFGSGKSVGSCAEIIMRSIMMPKCTDGIRRSKWLIVRNTTKELKSTSLQTWDAWFSRIGVRAQHVQPFLQYDYRFNDGNGVVELIVMFMPFDRPHSIGDAKSLDITSVWINEAAEIQEEVFDILEGRIGRYPAVKDVAGGEPFWYGVIMDTNPPPTEHWLYYLFEQKKPAGFEIFHQPPGLLEKDGQYVTNPAAENLANLPANYYLNLAASKSKEFIKVYCMGQYGIVKGGKVVYPEYNDDIHSIDDIGITVNEPILLAWDYGKVSPACLISQYVDGQLRCIKEFTCKYTTVKDLYNSVVKPFLTKYCYGFKVEAVGDPSDTYEGREQLDEEGLQVDLARTNNLDARLSCVSDFLSVLFRGKPGLLISRRGCPNLRKGFLGEYHYKRLQVIGYEQYKDEPNKNHPYSDIHDCLQYSSLHYKWTDGDVDYSMADFKNMKFDEETRSKVTGY